MRYEMAPAVGFEPAELPFIANDLDERAHPKALRKFTVDSGLDEIISACGDLPLPLRAAVLAVVRTHRARILDSDILQGPIRPEESATGSDLWRVADQQASRSAGEPNSIEPPEIEAQHPAKHLRHKHSALAKKTKTRKKE